MTLEPSLAPEGPWWDGGLCGVGTGSRMPEKHWLLNARLLLCKGQSRGLPHCEAKPGLSGDLTFISLSGNLRFDLER
jgi:hypothetical protein